MDDKQIIEMYLQRSESAVFETESKYKKYCRSVASRILQSNEDMEEALNDTWLAAWNSIPPHIPERLRSFLGKLTRNICLNMVRTQQTKKRGSGEVQLVIEEVSDWLGSDDSIDREIDEKELSNAINTFLDTVPEIERSIFVLRYWYFVSISEIAERYDFSESKVKSMLFRTRKKLYSKLEKEGYI